MDTEKTDKSFFFSRLIEEGVMNNLQEIIQAIYIGIVVATFLYMTGRARKAIELCKESLVLLNNKTLEKEEQFGKLLYEAIYKVMFAAYFLIRDYTNAIAYGRKLLAIEQDRGETANEGILCIKLADMYKVQYKYVEAKELNERAISIFSKIGYRRAEAQTYASLGNIFYSTSKVVKAREHLEKAIEIAIEIDDRHGERTCYQNLGSIFISLGDYVKAKEYLEKALSIAIEIGDREGEGTHYGHLGTVFISLCDYVKAKEYLEKALAITIEIGHRKGEGECCGSLGTVFISLGDYAKAKEYLEKALAIAIEIGDRKEEGTGYINLGTVFTYLADYVKAKEYLEKALAIALEMGDRRNEGLCYANLGTVFIYLGDYVKANEYLEKALATAIEIGDRKGEGSSYENLATVFKSLGHDYVKAKQYLEKALAIAIEIGDRHGEGSCYGNLGTVFISLYDYVKAKEYFEKALAIALEIGDRRNEGTYYEKLGNVLISLGDYVKAEEYLEKALAIAIEFGDRDGEGLCYRELGKVFSFHGDCVEAKEYLEKALAITIEIGNREREGICYGELGGLFISHGDYVKGKEYLEKALAIAIEIGARVLELSCIGNLACVFMKLGDYAKGKEYLEKALAIAIETGNRHKEGTYYGYHGVMFNSLGDYVRAREYLEKALKIAIETGDRPGQAILQVNLGIVLLSSGRKFADANKYFEGALLIATEIGDIKCEAVCYKSLGRLFERLGDAVKAKEHYEKALAVSVKIGDRVSEAEIYANLGSLCITKEDYTKAEEFLEKALSIAKEVQDFQLELFSHENFVRAKIPQGKILEAFPYLFQSIQKCEDCRGFLKDNDEIKVLYSDACNSPYRTLSNLFCAVGNPNKALYVEELGRARALLDLMATKYSVEKKISADPRSWTGIENVINLKSDSLCLYISYDVQNILLWILKPSGVVELRENTVDKKTLITKRAKNLDTFFDNLAKGQRRCGDDPRSNLTLFYKMIIAPVADLLNAPEIIIVPDRHLYRLPFPALLDDNGKYLSENFRIRIIPSLTTLKCIQDSPTDYHCQTGALIVGDPEVGEVNWKGWRKTIKPLPCARKEAKMIGRLLGVQPLIGKQATKEAVLQRINSVSLIHFAAHGNAERGEIILVPVRTGSRLPCETDCLLTVGDISQVQLRAKLVVLSCDHSAKGQIKVEGVVGMARAFLGSGARSVIVALWALEAEATEQFMNRFYKHLVRGESASESLHQAMKWMRGNGFAKISEWATFMLIGDNVTFDFGNRSKFKHFTLG